MQADTFKMFMPTALAPVGPRIEDPGGSPQTAAQATRQSQTTPPHPKVSKKDPKWTSEPLFSRRLNFMPKAEDVSPSHALRSETPSEGQAKHTEARGAGGGCACEGVSSTGCQPNVSHGRQG